MFAPLALGTFAVGKRLKLVKAGIYRYRSRLGIEHRVAAVVAVGYHARHDDGGNAHLTRQYRRV